jgi:ABC-type transport system involved in multi-copper enzyme maturation permease subunit
MYSRRGLFFDRREIGAVRKFLFIARYAFSDTLRQNLTLFLGAMYAFLICLFIFLVRVTLVSGNIATVSFYGGDPMTPGELNYVIPDLPRMVVIALFIVTVVLSVIATAHLLPEKLSPEMLSVLLARPVSRTVLLAGNYFGVISGVALLQLLFIVACWVVYSVKCSSIDLFMLWIFLPLNIAFAGVYALIAFFSMMTRKTAVLTGFVLAYCLYGTDFLTHLARTDISSTLVKVIILAFYFLLPPLVDLKDLSVAILSRARITLLPLFIGLLSVSFFLFAALLLFRRKDY